MQFFWMLCHLYSTRVMPWGLFDRPIENSSFTECIILHTFGQTRTKLKSLGNKIYDILGFHDAFRGRLYFLKIGSSQKITFLTFLRPFLKNLKLTRAVCTIWMQLPFFANALFWASGDNLGLERPANSCKQVAYVAGVQGKPKHCRALKVAKGPQIWFK